MPRPLDRRRTAAAALLLIATLLSTQLATARGLSFEGPSVPVIVQGTDEADLRSAVSAVGGAVTESLEIVRGVAAEVPKDSIPALEAQPSILQVTKDSAIGFQAEDFSLTPNRVPTIAGSTRLWDQGVTGAGVTVALLDTGVYAAHPDLAGRVVACEDLTAEAGTEAHCADTFGHGTFMAGLIAGNGASSGGAFKGTAPGANIVSVKVAGFDGATDVSNILAGIQWVVANKSAYGIRVLNLSLGTDSSQDYRTSPLNYAVEQAWKSGIAVVVSAGNSGPNSKTILKPADDPFVITVGASNDEETMAINDDRIPVFSSRGPTSSNGIAKPDIVAPGVHTISLRSPGSNIDQQYGANAVVQDSYFRGTGTSMSAATVSGIAAQVLQVTPGLNPNQVKYRLMSTARPIADRNAYAAGKGLVDAYAATRSTSTASANKTGLLGSLLNYSNGLGSLQGSRGTLGIDVMTLTEQLPLTGEYKAQTGDEALLGILSKRSARRGAQKVVRTQGLLDLGGLLPWEPLTYTLTGWSATSWLNTTFAQNDWAGASWRGASWRATEWDGASWRGASWRNLDWEGASWRGAAWDGASWRATNFQSAWYAAAWR